MSRRLVLFLLLSILFCSSCKKIPKDALILSPQSLSERQMQTRKYETQDEDKILSACSGLLQDMGFNLDESETELGLIASSKMRSAEDAGQIAGAVIVAILTGVATPVDKEQKMKACVVTCPVGENEEYIAIRVTFQRVVWNTQGKVTKAESLKDPEIYQEFFSKLSKAVFLEAHNI